MKVVALHSLKGGVGKTSAAVNLAVHAAASGRQVLLWDLDPQAAASWLLGADSSDGSARKQLSGDTPVGRLVQRSTVDRLALIPASLSYRYLDILLRKVEPPRLALRRLLKPFAERFELAVLDCPPSLSHLADNIFCAADRVLLPTPPAPLALRAVQQMRRYCREQELPEDRLRPFFSLVDRRRGQHRQALTAYADIMQPGYRSWVPYAASIERMSVERNPVAGLLDAKDSGLAAYRALWAEVEADLGLGSA